MVLDEIQYDKTPPTRARREAKELQRRPVLESRLASPVDRLAAVVADLIIFIPFMTLTVSPFKRISFQAQLVGEKAEWFIALISATGLAALTFVLFQTICLAVFSATPGKYILGLRVVDIWSQKRPQAMPAFVRSVAWLFEVLSLGIPFLAVSSNDRRRPLHDRLADTVVVTVDRRLAVGPPRLAEMSIASGLYSALLVVLLFFGSSVVVGVLNDFKSSKSKSAATLCPSVNEALQDWMSGSEAEPSRLSVAIALYGANAVNEDCLKAEAEHALWSERDKELAYLAQALAHADDENLYRTYFGKVCESGPSSEPCHLISVIRYKVDESIDDIDEKTEQVERENRLESIISGMGFSSPVYKKVWVIRHLMETQQYLRALELIDEGAPQRQLGFFYVMERARALWLLERKAEARLAMKASMETLEPSQKVDLARWFCFHETSEDGCTDEGRQACGVLSTAVTRSSHWLVDPEVEATFIRGEACREDITPERLLALEHTIPSHEGKTYLSALVELNTSKKDKAIEALKKLASRGKITSPFFFEANGLLIHLAGTPEDLLRIKGTWMRMKPGHEGWRYLGRQLVQKFQALQAWDQTLEVGLRMVESDRFDRNMYRSMVVAAFRAGNKRLAIGFLENLARLDESAQVRVPASVDEFEEVARTLMGTDEILNAEREVR